MKKLKILFLTLILILFSYTVLPSISYANPVTTAPPSTGSKTTTTTTTPSSTTTAPATGTSSQNTKTTTTTVTGGSKKKDKADTTTKDTSGDGGINPYTYNPNGSGKVDSGAVGKYIGPIYNTLYTISIIVTIITLSIVGLKFIGASVQEKAEYKQHLLPIAIGAVFITFLMTIISILAKVADLF